MKILCISDTVVATITDAFDKNQIDPVDAIISCGDLPPEYLTHLRSKLNAPLYYVMGNHDIRYTDSPPKGCTNIHGQIVDIGGKRMLGLGGSRWYNDGPNQYTETQMRWIIRGLRLQIWWKRGIDMVVTHAPPRFIHDQEDLCHRGFKSFRKLIDRDKPAYLLHGHIHRFFKDDNERITLENKTKVINCYGHYFLEY